MPGKTEYPALYDPARNEFNTRIYHELMVHKVREILLVSTPYDAFIMEEDGSIASKIIHEYRGLNLSRPPRLTQSHSGKEALDLLAHYPFDLVITMPNLGDMDALELVMRIKTINDRIPVIRLSHQAAEPEEDENTCAIIDNEFIWTGNAELLLALIKSVEDRMNAADDTRNGRVRVLILVEDSPLYRSIFLPLIYRVVVQQTVLLLDESLNEEHRLLKMRARPKILVAENYESAVELFTAFRPFVFGVISDTRYAKDCRMTEDAGFQFLVKVKNEIPHLPLLMLSSESANRERAEQIQAIFIDKNSPHLESEIERFFLHYLGFGDFVFRLDNKVEVGRASDLQSLEKLLPEIPDEPIEYHARRNHFSNWLMARSEIALASRFAEVEVGDFESIDQVRRYIVKSIHSLRRCRQKGMILQFSARSYEPDVADFVKIGKGSLGGKARGLAFVSRLIHQGTGLRRRYPDIRIAIPKTLVIATDKFTQFIRQNKLTFSRFCNCPDKEIRERFLEADIPEELFSDLKHFLSRMTGPLSIRSSSLLEDAHFRPFSGLYETFMIPNNHPDLFVRLHHLISAVKLVYASTFFERPRRFSEQISRQFREDQMAVMIQQLAGSVYNGYFYPAISGTARSHNFYPVGHMQPEDGICHIGLGLGSILEEAENVLRFSPRHPRLMPQFSTVDDILSNAQRYFYALQMGRPSDLPKGLSHDFYQGLSDFCLEKREIADAEEEFPVKHLAGTYIPEEHRIRDSGYLPGPKVMTFASVLKHGVFPLAELVSDLLDMGGKGLGGPVEIEFAVDMPEDRHRKPTIYFLQLRPLVSDDEFRDITITNPEIAQAFCFSAHSLGHGRDRRMADIVYVKPDDFDRAETVRIAEEIGKINAGLAEEKRAYLLAGPGRWGSSDRWLGIPVRWEDISGVRCMIELRDGRVNADASQGSHFFQKLTSRGIHYITVNPGAGFFDPERIAGGEVVKETRFLRHIRLEQAFLLKNDGKVGRCVLLQE